MQKPPPKGSRLINGIVQILILCLHGWKNMWRFIHRKKRIYLPFYSILLYALVVIGLIRFSGDPQFQKVLNNKRINDITQLNPIQVAQVQVPKKLSDIVQAIKKTQGPISIGGGRFSMGGQTGYPNSLHLDMRQMNQVLELDTLKKQVRVQAGITWRNLQKAIDPHQLSVQIMQTYANFTVGGSVSVNCHGRYIGHGAIVSSVLEMKMVLASGEVVTASRTENDSLFRAAIGGYGGLGVIAEVKLQLVDNVKVERQINQVPAAEYNHFFKEHIRNNPQVIFQNGDLYPPHFNWVNNVTWVETDKPLTDTTRVTPENVRYWLEPRLVELASWGDFGKWVRKSLLDPLYYQSEKVVWRNKEASYDVRELEPSSRKESTYVLQEYFIPVNRIESFIPKMKAVYDSFDVNVVNVSLRHAYPDTTTLLSWADEEVFAFVVYYKQGTDEASKLQVKAWTRAITDAILSENGKWYLPYQPHATREQFEQAFPKSELYFKIKLKYDSLHRFNNQLLDKYNPYLQTHFNRVSENIIGYSRAEEQTILTVPEWYLVFNPKEYADYLTAGKNPSDFPYYASIDEYWKLYDRSLKLVSEAYPENAEYTTMLQVIGVSITLEYALKMVYENTLGRLFSWFSNGTLSERERVIHQAHRAYSDFIYETAWYEFEFTPWIGQVWAAKDTRESNWFRTWERTLFFTFEFAFKAGYAQLIEWAAQASYEEPVTNIFLSVSNDGTHFLNSKIRVLHAQGNKKWISIPRWGTFTTTLLQCQDSTFQIHEIGGNDEIAVSVLNPVGQKIRFEGINLLYKSAVVTDKGVERLVYLLPVSKLMPFIRYSRTIDAEIEHIFDY